MSPIRSLVVLLGVSVIVAAPSLGAQETLTTPNERRSPIVSTTTGTGPNGATLRCRDGSYPAPNAADSACETKGGVLVRFPLRRVPQPVAAGTGSASATPSARAPRADSAAAEIRRPEGFVPYAERAAQNPTAPPEGATLLCTNGTYVVRDTTSARCATHGGVQLRFEPRRTP